MFTRLETAVTIFSQQSQVRSGQDRTERVGADGSANDPDRKYHTHVDTWTCRDVKVCWVRQPVHHHNLLRSTNFSITDTHPPTSPPNQLSYLLACLPLHSIHKRASYNPQSRFLSARLLHQGTPSHARVQHVHTVLSYYYCNHVREGSKLDCTATPVLDDDHNKRRHGR